MGCDSAFVMRCPVKSLCVRHVWAKVRYGDDLHHSSLVWHNTPPNAAEAWHDDWGVEWTPWVLLSDVSRQIPIRHTFGDLEMAAVEAKRHYTPHFQIIHVPSSLGLDWVWIRGQKANAGVPVMQPMAQQAEQEEEAVPEYEEGMEEEEPMPTEEDEEEDEDTRFEARVCMRVVHISFNGG